VRLNVEERWRGLPPLHEGFQAVQGVPILCELRRSAERRRDKEVFGRGHGPRKAEYDS
jgi:hypothetical protein